MLTVLVLAGPRHDARRRSATCSATWPTHPEHRQRLIDEPELIPSAVEESLRYYTIIFGDGRKVTRDTEFHGVQLKQGDMVYALVSGANRDPRAYERADEFVIDRKTQQPPRASRAARTAAWARTSRGASMQIAVEEWLQVIPDFERRHRRRTLQRARRRRDDDAARACRCAWEVPS